jgi:hypothetical protein
MNCTCIEVLGTQSGRTPLEPFLAFGVRRGVRQEFVLRAGGRVVEGVDGDGRGPGQLSQVRVRDGRERPLLAWLQLTLVREQGSELRRLRDLLLGGGDALEGGVGALGAIRGTRLLGLLVSVALDGAG